MQQGMLYHYLRDPHSGVDIEQMTATLREPLDPEAFRRAWDRLVNRHAAFRRSFEWEGRRTQCKLSTLPSRCRGSRRTCAASARRSGRYGSPSSWNATGGRVLTFGLRPYSGRRCFRRATPNGNSFGASAISWRTEIPTRPSSAWPSRGTTGSGTGRNRSYRNRVRTASSCDGSKRISGRMRRGPRPSGGRRCAASRRRPRCSEAASVEQARADAQRELQARAAALARQRETLEARQAQMNQRLLDLEKAEAAVGRHQAELVELEVRPPLGARRSARRRGRSWLE